MTKRKAITSALLKVMRDPAATSKIRLTASIYMGKLNGFFDAVPKEPGRPVDPDKFDLDSIAHLIEKD